MLMEVKDKPEDIKFLRARMGSQPGVNPLHVETENPYDLRPALTVCMQDIEQARSELESGQKLLINFGEVHDFVRDHALKIALVQGMAQKGYNPLVVLEMPHNFFSQEELRGMNPALVFSAFGEVEAAPFSHRCFHDYLWRTETEVILVDAAQKDRGVYLDEEDEKTRKFTQELYPNEDNSNIETEIPKGMHIRNGFMLRESFAVANEGDHDVIFLSQGSAHVAGNEISGYLYGHSTNGLARDPEFFQKICGNDEPLPKIINIMPHFRTTGDGKPYYFERMIPEEVYSDIPNTVIPTNLTEDFFKNTRVSKKNGCLDEMRCLTKFWKNSGGAEGQSIFLKPRPDDAMRQEAKVELIRHLDLAA